MRINFVFIAIIFSLTIGCETFYEEDSFEVNDSAFDSNGELHDEDCSDSLLVIYDSEGNPLCVGDSDLKK